MSQLGQELKFSEQQGMNTEGVSWNSSGLLAQGPGFLMSVCAQLSCDPVDCSPPGSSVHGISEGKNTGLSCHSLLQGIFPTRGLNPCLLHCRLILYHWATWESFFHQWGTFIVFLPSVRCPEFFFFLTRFYLLQNKIFFFY